MRCIVSSIQRVMHRALMVLSVAVLAACGSDPPVKPVKLTDLAPSAKVKEIWSNGVRSAQIYNLSPASAQGDIFAADTKGRLVRMEGRKGKIKWKVETKEQISGGVGVGGGLVLVGTSKGKVLAFDLDGKAKWTATVSSEVLAPPVANDAWVVVRSGDGKIYGLNASDGSKKWEFQAILPSLVLRSEASVSLEGEFVLAGLAGGKVVALRTSDGIQLWEAGLALPRGDNEIERIADVSGEPLRDRSYTCMASFQGRIGCFDLTKGTGVWARDASTARRLGGDEKLIFMVDERSNVFAFERESGAQLWKQEKLYGRRLSAPLAHGNFVVMADLEGYVHILSKQDGALVGRIRADRDPIRAAPVSVGDAVVVQSIDGDLTAISVQ